jgi:hypothetical protein
VNPGGQPAPAQSGDQTSVSAGLPTRKRKRPPSYRRGNR